MSPGLTTFANGIQLGSTIVSASHTRCVPDTIGLVLTAVLRSPERGSMLGIEPSLATMTVRLRTMPSAAVAHAARATPRWALRSTAMSTAVLASTPAGVAAASTNGERLTGGL